MSAATSTANPAEESGVGGGAKSNMTPLPLDFVPGDFDVLCGRGKKNYNSLGKLLLWCIVCNKNERRSKVNGGGSLHHHSNLTIINCNKLFN